MRQPPRKKSVRTDDLRHFEETPYGMLAFEIIVKMTIVEKAPVHSGVQTRKHVDIAVSDTGIGIAKDDLSRIFGRFWRADASRAREAGGLGVGLAVTKQIVERHHGYISVESELGKGTTFTIHLPREHTADAASTTMEH